MSAASHDAKPEREAVSAALARVLRSPQLQSSRTLSDFLSFVVEKTLAGEQDQIKEYTIGVEILHRPASFNPKADSVVRTQAWQLRRKLAEYYGGEGRHDPVAIELPKGTYVPEFLWRPQHDTAAESPGAAAESPGAAAESPGAAANRAATATAEPASAPRASRGPMLKWFSLGAAAACAVIAIVAALALGLSRGRGADDRATAAARPPSLPAVAAQTVWGGFLDGSARTALVIGVPKAFIDERGVVARDTLEPDGEGAGPPASLRKLLGSSLTPFESYTGVGEAIGVHLLTRFLVERDRDVRVARTQSVSWDDFSREHLIFVSSGRWKTLAKELDYPADFVFAEDLGRVINRRPQPGEQDVYWPSPVAPSAAGAAGPGGRSSGPQIDYAVVTLWPGKRPGLRIMMLGGAKTVWGTQAAAEYVTGLGYLQELERHLAACNQRAGRATHPKAFQMLLRAEIKQKQPLAISYVTHHDLTIETAALDGSTRPGL